MFYVWNSLVFYIAGFYRGRKQFHKVDARLLLKPSELSADFHNKLLHAYLGQVSLQLVPGLRVLLDAVGQGRVSGVPFVHQGRSRRIAQLLDVVAEIARRLALTLRTTNVVVAELGPRVGYRGTEANGPQADSNSTNNNSLAMAIVRTCCSWLDYWDSISNTHFGHLLIRTTPDTLRVSPIIKNPYW